MISYIARATLTIELYIFLGKKQIWDKREQLKSLKNGNYIISISLYYHLPTLTIEL